MFGRRIQWKKETEVEIEKGRYFDRIEAQKHTLAEAIDRYIKHILPSKPKNAKNVRHHLLFWKKQFGAFSLDAIKPRLIAEQQISYKKSLQLGARSDLRLLLSIT